MPANGTCPLPPIASPLPGPVTVTSPYGRLRRDPQAPGSPRPHTGVDLQARKPTPVLAVADGVVRVIHDQNTTAGGYYIIIELSPPTAKPYSGPTVGYMHLKARSWRVAVGSRVTAGQVIAWTGSSANGEDAFPQSRVRPHLHFEYNRPGRGVPEHPLGPSINPEGCIDVAPPPPPPAPVLRLAHVAGDDSNAFLMMYSGRVTDRFRAPALPAPIGPTTMLAAARFLPLLPTDSFGYAPKSTPKVSGGKPQVAATQRGASRTRAEE
jgi:murein DD-endopeptidase MepM/ murein hydrolase activator NlpD